MKNYNIVIARDMFLSLANKLPKSLLLDAVNEEGLFTARFLLQLKEEELCDLRREARKKEKNSFFLFFYQVSEKELDKKAPSEIKDFASFDFSKVKSFAFNGSTAPFLPYRDSNPVHYVSVVFVLKE